MKKGLLFYIFAAATLCFAASCSSDDEDVWEKYADYREANDAFINEQANLVDENGKKVYSRIIPAWNKDAYVLMRWFNDTTATTNNRKPIYTSTVDVKYYGRTYEDVPFDSSYRSLSPADSVSRFQLNSVISGWVIALEKMHIGDSVEVIVPYSYAYGSSGNSSIPPFSVLKFNIKLVDIPGQFVRPTDN